MLENRSRTQVEAGHECGASPLNDDMERCNGCGRPVWEHWRDSLNRMMCYNTPARPSLTQLYTNLCSFPPQVMRQRLQQREKHALADVLMNYGHEYQNASEEMVKAMTEKLDTERKELRAWATSKIKKRMLDRAIALGMRWNGEQVYKFSDISRSWAADGSDTNARKMYMVMFGDYEGIKAGWIQTMEREYMAEKKIAYLVTGVKAIDTKAGCYTKQISQCKTTQVTMMNRNCPKTIQMSCPDTGEFKESRRERRKEGDFFVHDIEKVGDGTFEWVTKQGC
jgi:hypothetical protein